MSLLSRSRRLLATSLFFAALLASGPSTLRAQSPSEPGPGASERSTPINAVPEKGEQEKDETEAFRHSPMVGKMGRMVGLNTEQAATGFEALNFLILVAGLSFLAVKTLPKAFRNRSSAIQKGLVDARSATEEASARLKAVELRLGRLDDEIASLREHADAESARDEERLKTSIEQETAKILSAAETEIQAATTAARRALQRHAAELAIQQAARHLVITPDTDRMLVEGFAERLATGKEGQN